MEVPPRKISFWKYYLNLDEWKLHPRPQDNEVRIDDGSGKCWPCSLTILKLVLGQCCRLPQKTIEIV